MPAANVFFTSDVHLGPGKVGIASVGSGSCLLLHLILLGVCFELLYQITTKVMTENNRNLFSYDARGHDIGRATHHLQSLRKNRYLILLVSNGSYVSKLEAF